MNEPKTGETGGLRKIPQRVKLTFDRNMFLDFHRKLLYCPKITIAQMHKYCLGVAFNLVLHCDLLIASEDCKVGHVEERLGQGGMTISPIMVLRCGRTRAMDLCLTGKMITGAQAAAYNLINRAVPEAVLDDEVKELAHGLALYPKDGIAIGKACREMMYANMGVDKGLVEHYIMHSSDKQVLCSGENTISSNRERQRSQGCGA
jgi:enoyl-CoA hydratase/carnithine racemase